MAGFMQWLRAVLFTDLRLYEGPPASADLTRAQRISQDNWERLHRLQDQLRVMHTDETDNRAGGRHDPRSHP